MALTPERPDTAQSDALMTTLVRIALILFVAVVCLWAFFPFLPIMLWALVLAVALYPLQLRLKTRLGSSGRAATVLALLGLLLIGVPTAMLGSSFAGYIFDLRNAFVQDDVIIPQPSPGVEDWPLIGSDVHEAWTAAAADLPRFLETLQPQLANFASWILGVAAGTAGVVFTLIGALIIAGIMMAYGEGGSRSIRRIFVRVAGPERGVRLHELTTMTIRSVAVGSSAQRSPQLRCSAWSSCSPEFQPPASGR